VKHGADNLFTKPVDLDKLVDELRRATEPATPTPSPSRSSVVLAGPRRDALLENVEQLRDVDCTLLIHGETGTGKTMLARRLHEESRRRDKPFVELNCAGLARDLLESELFGHERGAFTSAHAAKAGMFELADGGTLFLDEIGDIDPAAQPKVLKAIDEKRFRRMGSVNERKVDVRIIAATHKNLRDAIRDKTFRADLYYRLNTMTFTLRPLRERRAELESIARELLASLAAQIGRPIPASHVRCRGGAGGALVAGQRARAEERARARHAPDARLAALGRRPAHRGAPGRRRGVFVVHAAGGRARPHRTRARRSRRRGDGRAEPRHLAELALSEGAGVPAGPAPQRRESLEGTRQPVTTRGEYRWTQFWGRWFGPSWSTPIAG
jgi:hypothetical protein